MERPYRNHQKKLKSRSWFEFLMDNTDYFGRYFSLVI